jgi:hypothetical protein
MQSIERLMPTFDIAESSLDPKWVRRLAFDVNGDLRQMIMRTLTGPAARRGDTLYDTVFDRARVLMSKSRDFVARANTFGDSDLLTIMLFENHLSTHEDIDAASVAAEVFSNIPMTSLPFMTPMAEGRACIANILHTSKSVRPVFPAKLMDLERRRNAKVECHVPSCLGGLALFS